MKKLYEAPEMEDLLVVSERVMDLSSNGEDNETDIGDLLGGLVGNIPSP